MCAYIYIYSFMYVCMYHRAQKWMEVAAMEDSYGKLHDVGAYFSYDLSPLNIP